MRILLACGAASLALATVAFAQDANIHETVFRYRKSLSKIEGVIDVTAAAVNGDPRVLIRVRTQDAKEAIEQLIGKKLDGFPIHALVTAASKPVERPADTPVETTEAQPVESVRRPTVGQTVADPRPIASPGATASGDRPVSQDPFEECDILRETLGRKPRQDDRRGRCAWTRITKWVSPGRVERIGNGRDSDAACTHVPEAPKELSALELQVLRERGYQAVPAKPQKSCGTCPQKDESEPPPIPGSTGWHKGEGIGTTYSTVVARHRKACPVFVAEMVRRVFAGLGR